MIELIAYILILALWGEGFKTFFLKDFLRTWEFTKYSPGLMDRGLGVFLLLAMLAYPVTFVVTMALGYLFEGDRLWQSK